MEKSKSNRTKKINKAFDHFSNTVTKAAGKPITSLLSFLVIIVWLITGPFLGFSDTWQLIINTSTTIITFLMVFVIQQSQNKDTMAVQLKLNELIACQKFSSNRLIDIEDLSSDELVVLKKYYIKLARLAKAQKDLYSSHSLDEAEISHKRKSETHKAFHSQRRKSQKKAPPSPSPNSPRRGNSSTPAA